MIYEGGGQELGYLENFPPVREYKIGFPKIFSSRELRLSNLSKYVFLHYKPAAQDW